MIPGDPMGKQRPKFNRWTKSAHTPEKTVSYETYVKELYVTNRFPMLEGYIQVGITAFYKIPKSTSNKKRQQMLNNELLPDKKPDLDNVAKIICDALNAIAYLDDKQIVSLTVNKFYSEQPRVVVKLNQINKEELLCQGK
ncbi:RusA family crossover junction endodeoxyribonuclease [Clostridium tyrobutyricum]|nr:RusA family crossover junction endodeoxyribonuclease [Clostridium tyrobutyricum]MBV4436698.1 RusA family crossover junction endodeoxyribonuclease [Clostridium tyrobutyricum]